MVLEQLKLNDVGWPESDNVSYVVFVQPDAEYKFYFMADGTVRMHTVREGEKTIRAFIFADGVWTKEHLNG